MSPDINTTWLGMVGPGVQQLGVDSNVWSDHTDIRPTMMTLLGLKDDYSHDGRVLAEVPRQLRTAICSTDEYQLCRTRPALQAMDACVGHIWL